MPEPDKSLGRKILSFFIKDETAPNASPIGTPSSPATTSPVVASSSHTGPAATTPNPPGTVDTKFVDHFAAVLEKANVQGPDYFEFREMLRNLSELGLAENKRFQAAWASFKTLGGKADVSILINTANQYLSALGQDREAFLKSVEATLTERVGGLQSEQKQLQTENESLQKQIAEIEKRIAANNDRLGKITGEIGEQSLKLTQNRNNFEATYASFTEQIKSDTDKIQTYLK